MKRNSIMLKTVAIVGIVCTAFISNAFASEITGTLNSDNGTTTATSTNGTISGSVSGGSGGGSVSTGGGGGGGSIVVPSAAYSYGNGTNFTTPAQPTPTVLGASTDNTEFTGVGGADFGSAPRIGNFRTLAQANTSLEPDDTTATDTATITQPIIEQPVVTTAEAPSDQGPFDFFGISMWFWLVLLILVILIIAILYMQSL